LAGRLLGKESYQDYVNQRVMTTNAWLRSYARQEGVALLDIQPILSDRDGERRAEYAKADGSHLTAAAYQRLTEFANLEFARTLADVSSHRP
jgi:lysophospholipase L1-like esterase